MANVLTALLERLSWIVFQTRPLALSRFQEAAQRDPNWKPRYQCGPKVALVPAIPFKFLDIGTKMGCCKLGEHIPTRNDTDNIYHPRFIKDGIPPVNIFHAVIHDRASRWIQDADEWCLEEAWFDHSPTFDFRVIDPPGSIWGLLVLVPACPKKLFAQGPRQKYVDIVTDTLHASSSDLITWNTLVMIKMKWVECVPRQWIEITTQSLEAWELRDEKSPFLPDNRRGYARVTPVALSKVGVPNTKLFVVDEDPRHGLGLYEDLESWEQYSGYVWSTWTTKKAQPVHVDPALQAMIDQSLQVDSSATGQTYHVNDPSTSDTMVESKGSLIPFITDASPFPGSTVDVCMDTPVDKRSRESLDSTLKPEGKSLKTSGVASAATAESGVSSESAAVKCTTNEDSKDVPEPPIIRWKVAEIAETRQLMWQLHHRMPAWKLKAYTEALQVRPIDLTALAETTGVQFASAELVEVAVS